MSPSQQNSATVQLAAKLAIHSPSAETELVTDWCQDLGYRVSLKRDDVLHPIISGNKWRKLKYSLLYAQEHNIGHIISFGGGFSNHLHALAYCCHQLNIKFTAVVRGDYRANPSPMLRDLLTWQSHIEYVNKQTYQLRNDPVYLTELQQRFPSALIIPEGGSNTLALQGVAEIVHELSQQYDYIIAPVASGGTLAGLIQASQHLPLKILGIAVLKGEGYLEALITELMTQSYPHWAVCHDYHFGGYAKSPPELLQFCRDFYQQTHIAIEPVYSGKLFYALRDLCRKQFFPAGSRILLLHTGGMQGARKNTSD